MKPKTTKCYLDANVLIYFVNKESEFHIQTLNHLEYLLFQNFDLVISSLVLDEFVWGIKRLSQFNGLDETETVKSLRIAFDSVSRIPGINIVGCDFQFKTHKKVINFIEKYSLRPRDAYHLLFMKVNSVDWMYTYDRDFDVVFEKRLVKKA